MSRIDARTKLLVALRANLLQATWNFERQQGIGWAYAFHPVLRRLYPDPVTRLDRLAEHTAYFNTQPTLASLALGAAARLEEERASGEADADAMVRLKSALGSTLAALGDRLFWFSLRPFASVAGVLVALTHPDTWWGATVLVALYALPHLALRFVGVHWGHAAGPGVLGGPLRSRLEAAMTVLAYAGCMVLGAAVAWSLAPGGEPRPIAVECALAGGMGLGLLTAPRARPSPTQWALGLGALGIVAAWLRQG